MYSVIVVDDEPTALNHICTIIRMKCPEFIVIETAENGRVGFEKVCKYKPDVVITDIKMPVMTGIEMVRQLSSIHSEIYAIIISGYQEFEYVQSAIKSSVVDYILKPIGPSDLKEVLGKIYIKLQNKAYEKRNKLLRSLFQGEKVGDWEVKKYFSSSYYYGAVIRHNGLPKRFSEITGREIFSFMEDVMFTYGRDEMEALYLCPEEALEYEEFSSLVQHEVEKRSNGIDYTTSVIYSKSFSPNEIPIISRRLYHILDSNIAIGYSQIIRIGSEEWKGKKYNIDENIIVEQIEYLLKKNKRDKVNGSITQFIKECEKVRYPQLLLEGAVRKILYTIQKYGNDTEEYCNNEFMLEDAFYYATTVNELLESLQDIYMKYLKEDKTEGAKVDTPEFLENIKEYILLNIAENISLQSICKIFGISQTYLSKMFRKYENISFNNYLTYVRIEKAKQLLRDNEELFIKDVATMVGYRDQFYFSRIFRSIVGICPSDYNASKVL